MYLFVKFHDNDFGNAFINGLNLLWKNLKENNYKNVSMAKIFEFLLHNDEALHKLVHRYIVMEAMLSQAEHSTRGIAGYAEGERMYPYECNIDKGFGSYADLGAQVLHLEKYLSGFSLSIEENKLKSKEWNNGESFMLNINTGETESF